MTINAKEFIDRAQIDRQTLEVWIEEEWVLPSRDASEIAFSEADLARAALICDLKEDLGVNEEGVGVILNLLDQVHGLRTALAHVIQPLREGSAGPDADGSSEQDKDGK